MGSTMISWSSWKQSTVVLSTAEAKYTAAYSTCREAVWLRKLLASLFGDVLETTIIHCDNQSCVKLLENPVFHDQSKHIDMRYHYIKNMVERGVMRLQYISTDEQIADVFTKPLSSAKFVYFRDKLDMAKNASLVEREC